VPPELAGLFPEGRYPHTCDFIDFEGMRGKWCLIVGGRQSAFERRVPFLAQSNILAGLKRRDGFPELGEDFESSVRGLFITSMPAGQQFGPFFGFTIAVRTSRYDWGSDRAKAYLG
jgi:hypothetical protein